MKKSVFTLVLMLALAISGYAQMKMNAGVDVGYMQQWMSDYLDSDNNMLISVPMLSVGGYFDFTYVRFGVSYAFNIDDAQAWMTVMGSEGEGDLVDFQLAYIILDVLGKYPIELGTMILYPAIGVRYAICTSFDLNGDGVDDLDANDSMNDFYILAGAGLEFDMDSVVFGVKGIFGYNLTPTPDSDAVDEWSMNNLVVSFYAGFKL